MKVLVIKPTALGDVAQALAVVPALKVSGCASRLDWVVDEDYLPLMEACPEVDRAIPFPRRRWRGGGWLRGVPDWVRRLRGDAYDVVLDLQGLARSALMTRAARARRRIGLASAREGARLAYSEIVDDRGISHAVDRYARAVAQILGQDPSPWFRPFPRPTGALPETLEAGSYVVLHPYSIWETKFWPWENYSRLGGLLPDVRFVLVGNGPRFPWTAANGLDLRGRTPLDLLLRVLAGARAVVGTDSGPAHLAALFGVPLITLFGATDPARTAPRARGAQVLAAAGLPCRPCLSRTCGHSEPMACLRAVSAGEVARALGHLA